MMSLLRTWPFPSFNPDSEPNKNGENFTTWIGRFENYLVGINVNINARKKALLLHLAGEPVYQIYQTIKNDDDCYDDAKNKLMEYFVPIKHVQYSIYQFRSAQQAKNETLDQYVTRLRHLAKSCDFTDLDKEIFSQVVMFCKDDLRKKVIQEPDITLNEFLAHGRWLETFESIDISGQASN